MLLSIFGITGPIYPQLCLYLIQHLIKIAPAICVKNCKLILSGFDNMRMAMAHVAHVVDAVKELGSCLVVHVLT